MKMRVLEAGYVFQPVAQGAVEADMGNPNRSDQKNVDVGLDEPQGRLAQPGLDTCERSCIPMHPFVDREGIRA